MIKNNWTLYGIIASVSTIVCLTICLPIYFVLDDSLSMNISFYGFGIAIALNFLIYLGFVYKVKSQHKKIDKKKKQITKEEVLRMTNDPNTSIEVFMETELAKGYKVFFISLAITFGIVVSMITTLIMYFV